MTLSKIIFISCAVLFLPPASVIAQADFFQKGESGVGFLVGYAEGNNSSTIQRTAIVTLAGVIDIGVSTSCTRFALSRLISILSFERERRYNEIPFYNKLNITNLLPDIINHFFPE